MSILRQLPRFRRLETQLHELEMRESWTRGAIEAWQLRALNEQWRHAAETTKHFQSIASTHRLPSQFGSLEEYFERMPILEKSLVQADATRFLSCSAAAGSWLRTGGSTGDPTKVFWQHSAHLEMLRAKYRGEQSFGLDTFDRKVFFWGHRGSIAPGVSGWIQRVRRPLEDHLRNRMRVSAYELDDQNLLRAIDRIRQFQPQSIYGYSSAIALLADVCERYRIQLPSLKLAIMTAEPADEQMIASCRRAFGCDVTMEYGSCECGLIAYRTPDGILRTRDDLSIVETIRNQNGEYEIVVTVLNNPSFPLLRYRIGDLTTQPWRREENGFGILSDVQGRANDLLVTRTGKRLHSMSLKHEIEQWHQIRRFSAKQERCGDLTIRLESSDRISETLTRSLQTNLESLLEGYRVTIERVDCIPGNLAGKHRWIVSELANQPTDVNSNVSTVG